MVMGAKRVQLLFAILTCVIVLNPLFSAEDFTSILKQAVNAYDKKQFANSVTLLRKAQTLNPSSAKVAEWLDRVIDTENKWTTKTGRETLINMLLRGKNLGTKEGHELATVVQQLLRKTAENVRQFVSDPKVIKATVQKLYETKEVQDWLRIMIQAKNKHGRYLVPALTAYLDKQEPQDRIFAQRALIHLGSDAVIPLIVDLDNPNPIVRDQIARILGQIGNPLAISSLKNLVETDPNDVVKTSAKQALTRFSNVSLQPGWKLLVKDAITFIQGRNFLPRPNYGPYVWRFENGKLTGAKVLPFEVNRTFADTLLYRSTKAAKDELMPWTQFVTNRAAYVRIYHDTLALMKKVGTEESSIALLEGQAVRVEKLSLSISKVSLNILAAALQQELQVIDNSSGLPAGSLELINQISDAGQTASRNKNAIAALLSGLKSKYRLIRFDAALALARLKPDISKADGASVIDNLASAVQFPGARVALIVSPDEDVRTRFIALLDHAGFFAIGMDNALKGLAEASQYPPKHIILIDSDIQKLSIPETINYLRSTKGGANIPVIILSDNVVRDRDLYHKPENKVQVVTTDVKLDNLKKNILDPIVQGLEDNRSQGEKKAHFAAEAILNLLQSRSNYDMAIAKKSLMNAVSNINRPDNVRIPAAESLGFLGDVNALKILSEKVSKNKENSTKVRIACIKAIGEILSRLNISLNKDGDLNGILKSCLNDKEMGIRVEAARAIGKAQWKPDRILNFK